MSQFNIEVQGGSSVRLPTAGKYCDRDIIVTASGGGGAEELENLIDHFNKSKYAGQDLFRDYPHATFPHIDFSTTTGLIRCFYNSQITSFNYYIDSKSATNVSLMFADMKSLVSMVGINTSNATNINSTFSGCVLLETIQEPLDFSKATNIGAVFTKCNALKNILFKENSIKVSITIPSPVLSDESIESILKGLAPVETTQTLTISQTVYNKMLEDEFFDLVSEVIDKGWNIGY